MGNIAFGRPFSLGTRNKEFLSVAPSPSSHGAAQEAAKIERGNANRPQTVQELLQGHDDIVKEIPRSTAHTLPSLSTAAGAAETDLHHKKPHEFQLPEGKLRREHLAEADGECSQVSDLIYVGGANIAGNYELLKQIGIKRIVNCASIAVPNVFEGSSEFRYLTLNLLDGRQEDLSWFMCQVLQFILEGTSEGQKVLLHCEKGISRSTSFAIAHRIWEKGESWKVAFDAVKAKRKICSPNTAFTVNVIEFAELLHAGPAAATLLFRCAYHAPHDPDTAVLKLCRNHASRRILVPSTSLLNPIGVFVIRAVRSANEHELFVWHGRESSPRAVSEAMQLAKVMYGVFSSTTNVQLLKQGEETPQFLSYLVDDGPFTSHLDINIQYTDYLGTCYPTEAELNEAALILRTGIEAQQLSVDSQSGSSTPSKRERQQQPQQPQQQQSQQQLQLRSGTRTFSAGDDEGTSITSATTSTKERLSPNQSRALRGGNNGGMTIAAAISRTNSFSSVDSDGVPVLSNAERLNKIQMIVDSATSCPPSQQQQQQPQQIPLVSLATVQQPPVEEAAAVDMPKIRQLPVLPLQAQVAISNEIETSAWRRETGSEHNNHPPSNHESDSDDDDRMVLMTSPIVHPQPSQRPQKLNALLDLNLSKLPIGQNTSPTGASSNAKVDTGTSPSNMMSNRSGGSEGQRSNNRLLESPDRPGSRESQHSTGKSDEVIRTPSKIRLPLTFLSSLLSGGESGSRPQSSERRSILHSGRVAPDVTIASPQQSQQQQQQQQQLSPPQRLLLPIGKSPNHSNTNSRTSLEPVNRPSSATAGIALVANTSDDAVAALTAMELTKPTLFHASLNKSDESVLHGEWVKMGVYDDNDLDEGQVYLLLCPDTPHYLWLGTSSRVHDIFMEDVNKLQNWAVNTMAAGDIASFDVLIIENDLSIQRTGTESEEFWDRFYEGF